jgi:ubiquinone/menaquinone biosynthesis C-methylase UbiE
MLLAEVGQTLWVAGESLRQASTSKDNDDFYIETLGITEDEQESLRREINSKNGVDPVASYMVAATSGYLYKPLAGKISTYPIPELNLPKGQGKTFLDIGCNWGRWCIAAHRWGYMPVGIDPSLGAVMAARRISDSMGINAIYVVADARYLPFASNIFDVVFSYSVLQHFSRENVRLALSEAARVLKTRGLSLIQMPNKYGVRSLFHQAKRRFREGQGFEVRYWSPSELKRTFSQFFDQTSLFVDGYFGLGIQKSDAHLLPLRYKLIVHTSEVLRGLSFAINSLSKFADSLYVRSVKSE